MVRVRANLTKPGLWRWDEIKIDGDIAAKDCLVRYKLNGLALAVASIFRDVERAEAAMDGGVVVHLKSAVAV